MSKSMVVDLNGHSVKMGLSQYFNLVGWCDTPENRVMVLEFGVPMSIIEFAKRVVGTSWIEAEQYLIDRNDKVYIDSYVFYSAHGALKYPLLLLK